MGRLISDSIKLQAMSSCSVWQRWVKLWLDVLLLFRIRLELWFHLWCYSSQMFYNFSLRCFNDQHVTKTPQEIKQLHYEALPSQHAVSVASINSHHWNNHSTSMATAAIWVASTSSQVSETACDQTPFIILGSSNNWRCIDMHSGHNSRLLHNTVS